MAGLVRTLIVDDEPLNRDELRYLLSQHSDVEIVGEADASTAAAQPSPGTAPISCYSTFVSTAVPGASSSRPGSPRTARHASGVVTAHPEHALEAYDHPAHFLVKPIDDQKLPRRSRGCADAVSANPKGHPDDLRCAIKRPTGPLTSSGPPPTYAPRTSSTSARTS